MANRTLNSTEAMIVRLAVGAIFGFICGWLGKMLDVAHHMPDGWIHVVISTLMLGAFILWAGAGTMRRLSLVAWGVIALGVIALIAWNHDQHKLTTDYNPIFFDDHFLIYPFLFIAHELVSSADMAGKPVAPYGLYFDQAWKRGVQLALAVLFTVLFWAILWLGATLLGFIGFGWLKELLQNDYFIGPVIGMALGAAVQLGDVQAKLLGYVRALVLGVLSWLLPVIAVIGVIFAASLCFSGLKPLWDTRAATVTLLAACVALVLLINAAYQQGNEERPVHIVLRWAVRLAALLLLVFSNLAAYSLYLRIAQYGLTPERTLALAGVVIAVLYGIGYAIAAVLPGRWFRLAEPVNIAMAAVLVVVFGAMLTPLAEPARVSVTSQVSRLQAGQVTVEKFDWKMLRFETGNYGSTALDSLIKGGKTKAIRDAAIKAKALTDEDRYDVAPLIPEEGQPDIKHITVVAPKDGALPADFLAGRYKEFGNAPATPSMVYVAMVDLNRDGAPEILVLDNSVIWVYGKVDGAWRNIDTLYPDGDGVTAFQQGKVSAAPPEWDDLKIGDSREAVREVTH